MGVWSWICPKPVLKVAGKTIIENLSRKNTDESYILEGKRSEKMHANVTKCLHCQQKCTQYICRPVHICKIKQKTSFTVSCLHKPHHWRCDISSRKHHHIDKAQSMVWRRFYKYTCHVSTNFCTWNFLSLCLLLKLLVTFSTVDWYPYAPPHPIPS